jgi:hypothetical protein
MLFSLKTGRSPPVWFISYNTQDRPVSASPWDEIRLELGRMGGARCAA